MVLIPVLCPHCQSDRTPRPKGGEYGHLPEIKEQIVDMALNGSGIRDTARVLKISPMTVINELKKRIGAHQCQPIHLRLVKSRRSESRDTTG